MKAVALVLLTILAVSGCAGRAARANTEVKPTVTSIGNQMYYHGGQVMTSPSGTNLCYIWYGDWSGSTTPAILTDLARHLGGSPFFNVLTTYRDASNGYVVNRVNYRGSRNDAYSQGTSLTTQKIKAVVTKAILAGLPKDANAVYVVLASKDISVDRFGPPCGTDTRATILESDIKYVFVGSPIPYLEVCTPRLQSPGGRSVSPNGNQEADGMANFLVHHLENLITNPDGLGWYDSPSAPSLGYAPNGLDASHKCKQWWDPAFTGAYVSSNGSFATIRLGKRDYLVASTWVNANGGYCALHYP